MTTMPIIPAAVKPITALDRKRAAYFKLALPEDAPLVDEIDPAAFAPRRFEPTPEDDAERLGYDLGYAGEPANSPAGWEFPRMVAFYRGWIEGTADLQEETQDFHAWLDTFDRSDLPEADWHEERQYA